MRSSAWLDIKVERGEAVVGHKIGLTSRAMQAAMKIDTPDSGFLTADMVFEPNTTIDAARFTDPKLEIGFAFVLATDLAGTDLTIDDVLDATDSVTLDRTDRRPVVPGRCRDRTHPHGPRHHQRQRRRRRHRLRRTPGRPREVDLRWRSVRWAAATASSRRRPRRRCARPPGHGIIWLARRYANRVSRSKRARRSSLAPSPARSTRSRGRVSL